MNKRISWKTVAVSLTLAGVCVGGAFGGLVVRAQEPAAGETTLTGAAQSAAQKQILAWYVAKDKIRAKQGRRASFEQTTTPDFTFVFAPADKTEVIARDAFFQKTGGGKRDPKAKDFLHDGPKAQPNRFVSRNGGKEIVLYEYPLLAASAPGPADDAMGKPGAAQKQVTTFTFTQDFVKTPKGLLMKSMSITNMGITINGEALPASELSGLTFDMFAGAGKSAAKPVAAPAATKAPPTLANPPAADSAAPPATN